MMQNTIIHILNGLKKIGVKGDVVCIVISEGRIKVFVDGEVFGIWDSDRRTFVD